MKTCYRRDTGVARRVIADETLLVPFRGTLASLRQVFALNELAAFVWDRLDGATSCEAILAQILERYDVTEERARADVEELVANLEQAGLIQAVDAEPVPVAAD